MKYGKETHVYRTDSASDKKNMLAQFRHIAEELSAKKRKEREGEHERRKSLWGGGGSVRPRGSSDIPLLNLRLLRSAVLLPQGKSLLFRIG